MVERAPYTSPKGEVLFAALNSTEKYKGKDTGSFCCKLILAGAALEQARNDLTTFLLATYGPHRAAQAWKDHPPIKKTKDLSSFLVFRASAEAFGKPRKITIYDSKGNRVRQRLNIGSGSIVRVRGTMSPFSTDDAGVALFMSAIQVIKYVPYVLRSGFEAEEDGDFFADDSPEDMQPPCETA